MRCERFYVCVNLYCRRSKMKETRKRENARARERERQREREWRHVLLLLLLLLLLVSALSGFESAQDNSEYKRVRCRLFHLPLFLCASGRFLLTSLAGYIQVWRRGLSAPGCAQRGLAKTSERSSSGRCGRHGSARAPFPGPPRYTDEEAVSAATVFAKEARAG